MAIADAPVTGDAVAGEWRETSAADAAAPATDDLHTSAEADAGPSRAEAEPAQSELIGAAEPASIEPGVPVAADTPVADTAAADTVAVDAPVADAPMADAPVADAPVADAALTSTTEASAAEIASPPDDGPAFLAKLARAMHTTVARERARIDEDVERRRAAHLQAVRDRAASDVEGIRALASEDMKAIETWVEGEMRRIKLEREQRERALNDDLDLSLKDRDARTEREVATAETAIAAYRAKAEAFFADLDREMDPVQIAQQASGHPAFPSLDASPDGAAADGSGAVGVMGVPSIGGRGLMGAMSFGSRSLPGGAIAGDNVPQASAREAATVRAGTGSPAANGNDSPLDSLLGRRSGN